MTITREQIQRALPAEFNSKIEEIERQKEIFRQQNNEDDEERTKVLVNKTT